MTMFVFGFVAAIAICAVALLCIIRIGAKESRVSHRALLVAQHNEVCELLTRKCIALEQIADRMT